MTTLEDRLQRLEDRDVIHQLFINYGRFLDAGDLDGYAALFAENGEVMFGPMGRAAAVKQIMPMLLALPAQASSITTGVVIAPGVSQRGILLAVNFGKRIHRTYRIWSCLGWNAD